MPKGLLCLKRIETSNVKKYRKEQNAKMAQMHTSAVQYLFGKKTLTYSFGFDKINLLCVQVRCRHSSGYLPVPCSPWVSLNVQKEVLIMAVVSSYETVMVISNKLGEDAIAQMVEKFKSLIERHATLEGVDEWGARRLAYPINKESEGYYVLFNFKSTAEFPAELDRRYKITDGVLRSLIIKKEEE